MKVEKGLKNRTRNRMFEFIQMYGGSISKEERQRMERDMWLKAAARHVVPVIARPTVARGRKPSRSAKRRARAENLRRLEKTANDMKVRDAKRIRKAFLG